MIDMLYEKQGSYLQGKKDGEAEGALEKARNTAKKLLKKPMSLEEIADITELPIEEVKAIKASLN